MTEKQPLNIEVTSMHYQKLLIAIDDDDPTSSKRAFNYACTVAKMYQIPMGIVSILETGDLNIYHSLSPNVVAKRREEIAADLDIFVQKAQEFGVQEVTPILGEGNPSHVIVEEIIPEFKPDLVICGSKTKPSKHLIGTHASYLSKYAPSSVMVVR